MCRLYYPRIIHPLSLVRLTINTLPGLLASRQQRIAQLCRLNWIRFRSNPLCVLRCWILVVVRSHHLGWWACFLCWISPSVQMQPCLHHQQRLWWWWRWCICTMHVLTVVWRPPVYTLTPLTFHERKSLNKQSGLRCYKVLIFSQIRQIRRGGFLSFIRTCDGLWGFGYLGSGAPRQAGSASRSFCILILFYFLFLFLFILGLLFFLILLLDGFSFFVSRYDSF